MTGGTTSARPSAGGAVEPSGTATSPPTTAALDENVNPRLVAFLVCPVTRHPLTYDAERQELVSKAARLAFPVRDGVPLMTLEASRPLTDEEMRGR